MKEAVIVSAAIIVYLVGVIITAFYTAKYSEDRTDDAYIPAIWPLMVFAIVITFPFDASSWLVKFFRKNFNK